MNANFLELLEYLFDSAPSHKKYPSDSLNVAAMNVYPGPIMRDTTWNGNTQSMVLPDGTPKGMKLVLQERGIDVRGMNAEKMRQKLNEFHLKSLLINNNKNLSSWTFFLIMMYPHF